MAVCFSTIDQSFKSMFFETESNSVDGSHRRADYACNSRSRYIGQIENDNSNPNREAFVVGFFSMRFKAHLTVGTLRETILGIRLPFE